MIFRPDHPALSNNNNSLKSWNYIYFLMKHKLHHMCAYSFTTCRKPWPSEQTHPLELCSCVCVSVCTLSGTQCPQLTREQKETLLGVHTGPTAVSCYSWHVDQNVNNNLHWALFMLKQTVPNQTGPELTLLSQWQGRYIVSNCLQTHK